MIDLDWTLAASSAVFLITLWALNRLLFQPLLATLAERRARTVDLEAEAAAAVGRHEDLFDRYSSSVKQEKQLGYQLAEAARAEAMEGRKQVLGEARTRADELLSRARADMEKEVRAAESGLHSEVEELARLITRRALRQT